jgi:hypothetical protein
MDVQLNLNDWSVSMFWIECSLISKIQSDDYFYGLSDLYLREKYIKF